MKKPLTPEQVSTLADLRVKASDRLHQAGFNSLRQFVAQGCGPSGESFEIWSKDGHTALLQFYAEGGGVELYRIAAGNSWASFSEALKEIAP